jgi:PncC family amidohydrolase
MSEALVARALSLLRQRGLTLAVAEGSSGGTLSHLITEVPGCSDVFLGGVVAYHNRLKELTGTAPAVLLAHGAVSQEATLAMAAAVRMWAGAHVGLAISGIAGPGGGTREKPVGLTYVAVDGPRGAVCWRRCLLGDRSQIKKASALLAIELLLHTLEGGDGEHGH